MKNLVKLFSILTLAILITSCEKDQFQESYFDESQTDLSGELMGEKVSQQEFENLSKAISKTNRNTKIADFSNKELQEDLLRSRYIYPIQCGSLVYSTTLGETNTVSVYTGADKVYELKLDSKTDLEFNLNQLYTDLDLFLAEVVTDASGRKLIGNYLGQSTNAANQDETIKTTLEKGNYFVIVETYNYEGPFALEVKCKKVNGPWTHCEDFENLVTSYSQGVSQQSAFWTKWSNQAGDGLVLYENSQYNNKVVKFDARRFGYQDAVRSIIGLPLSAGLYEVNFKMYIPAYKRADFLTEKTQQFGEEQGHMFTLENGTSTLKYRGNTYSAYTKYDSDKWIDIVMYFDMENNLTYTYIDNKVLFITDARSKINSRNWGLNSIFGINFFTKRYNSKFHIDNVCIVEHIPGYDDPLKIKYDINGIETIDMRDF